MLKKIVVTGGSGRFGIVLKKQPTKHKVFFPNKKQLNILNYKNIENYLKKKKPKILIHLAGLSRPMNIHEKNISKSIDLNIIGTAKLIYFSTNYVYPGKRGNYNENDSLLPVNNYAWSKLGGEAAVHLYKKSLILRVSMTEKPFVHKFAFANVKSNFMYQEEVATLLFKLLGRRGILNIGGKKQSVYNFVKLDNKKIKKSFLPKNSKNGLPFDSSTNILKLKKILNRKKN